MIEAMGKLSLVRHGQASFGAADYDQLSPLGAQQCRLLGAYWRGQQRRFAAVLTGTLKRHAQSLAAIREGYGEGADAALPAPLVLPGLDEYDSEAVIRAYRPGETLERPRNAAEVKQYFRLLRDGLQAWIAGRIEPEGMPRHADFVAGVVAALDQVRELAAERGGAELLIVSSGGPISTAVAHVLGAPQEAAVELNLQLRNSALTEFQFGARGHQLMSFNHLPHLEAAGQAGLASYA